MTKGVERIGNTLSESVSNIDRDSDQKDVTSISSLSKWLNKYGIDANQLHNPETQKKLRQTMSIILDAADKFIIKSEPGYPSELSHIYKAKYARGLVVEKILSVDTDYVKPKTDLIIGYEGLDVEMWFLKGNKIRLVSFKRLGYKNINNYLGHEEANAFRDITLFTLDQLYEYTTLLGDENFESGILMAQTILNYCYGNEIKPQEQSIVKIKGGDISKIIQKTRVISSAPIEITPDLDEDEAISIISKARRQVEAVSKLMQLESLGVNHDQEFQSNFGMRSMIVELGDKLAKRQLLSDYLESLKIDTDLSLQMDNGQTGEYNSLLQSKIDQVSTFLKERLQAYPVAEALVEFYQRPVCNVREYNCIKAEINNLISGNNQDDSEKILEQFLSKILCIITPEFISPEGFPINDILVKFQIAEALKNNQKFLILHADREGVLYLNSRVGVQNVDEGLTIQSIMAEATIDKINNLDGLSASFCLRNVDENIIVITEEKENSLANNLRIILESLDHMYSQMGMINQFKIKEEEFTFQSHAVGLLLKVSPDQFGDPQQVLMAADSYSAYYKKTRHKLDSPYVYLENLTLEQINIVFINFKIPPIYRSVWYSLERFMEAISQGELSPFKYSQEERERRIMLYYQTNPLIYTGLVFFMEHLVNSRRNKVPKTIK